MGGDDGDGDEDGMDTVMRAGDGDDDGDGGDHGDGEEDGDGDGYGD